MKRTARPEPAAPESRSPNRVRARAWRWLGVRGPLPFLALGLVFSVAAAWACAWRGPSECENVSDAAGTDAARAVLLVPGALPADFVSTWRGFGVREKRVYLVELSTPDGPVVSDAAEGRESLRARLRDSLPASAPDDDAFMSYRDWVGTRAIPADADAGFVHVLHRRAGWPLACLEQWWYPWSGAATVFDYDQAMKSPPPPLLPIPLGLAVNSALYGVATWAAWAVAASRIGAFRRRAGRCPSCGYPLPGTGLCPECGAGS